MLRVHFRKETEQSFSSLFCSNDNVCRCWKEKLFLFALNMCTHSFSGHIIISLHVISNLIFGNHAIQNEMIGSGRKIRFERYL